MKKETRRSFIGKSIAFGAGAALINDFSDHSKSAPVTIKKVSPVSGDWIRSARVFRIDGYQYPLDPRIDFDAKKVVKVMEETGLNVCRIASMGKYSYMQGVDFTPHPDLGDRDLVAETISACKPRGIIVLPYISTGNRLAETLLIRDYPEYAQAETPGGGPKIMEVPGEARANVCWNSPYRKAFLDLIRHLVDDYDIDGLYFDAWMNAWYHYSAPHTCYCKGCTDGFRNATGMEIPYHSDLKDYTPDERMVVRRYLAWKWEQMIDVFLEVRRIADRRGLPMTTNVNNLWRLEKKLMEPRMWNNLEAVMYESIDNMLERWESLSGAAAQGKPIWPYVSSYNESSDETEDPSRFKTNQHLLSDAMLGGGQVITNQRLLRANAHLTPIAESNKMLTENRQYFEGFTSVPYAAVVYQYESRGRYALISGAFNGPAEDDQRSGHNMRASTQGAYGSLLNSHIQVSSVLSSLPEDCELMSGYKVLYLADVPYLTPEQIAGIKNYVFGGGGLIASCETSLYGMQFHETGLYGRSFNRYERFMLEDLLKVRPAEKSKLASTESIGISVPEWGIDEGKVIKGVPVQEVELLEGAEEIGYFYTAEGGNVQKLGPAVVRSVYGKGRVLYISASLESAAMEKEGSARELLLRAVREAAGEPSPYKIESEGPLYVNMTGKDNTIVLHLLNSGESKGEGVTGDIPPVRKIKGSIRLPEGRKLKVLRTMRGSEPEWKESGGEIIFELPALELYEALLIELSG